MRTAARNTLNHGFTVIEMLVVMAAVALLVSVVAPTYLRHVDRARELVLKQNLLTTRDAIDKFKADKGRYPSDLQELFAEKYLRSVPVDPMTQRQDTWRLLPEPQGGVADLRSGSPGIATDGSRYANW